MYMFLLLLLVGGCTAELNHFRRKPNIVLILTDDQDADVNSLAVMTKLKSLVTEKGASFTNSFVNNPICCPSRTSTFLGQYMHNHGVSGNSIESNCGSASWQDGPEKNTFPLLMNKEGYTTFYAGKYINNYGKKQPGGLYVPPGWSLWFANQGNSVYFNYNLSVNGTTEYRGYTTDDYLTNVIEKEAVSFIDTQTKDKPFFMMLTPSAPHYPFTPEPKYKSNFSTESIPKTPNFNIANEKKNWFLQYGVQPLRQEIVDKIELAYKNRLRTLLSVDDMVESIVQALESKELLKDTYIFYTSDHGYHTGQFALPLEKSQPYDFDIRVPLLVRGPGISEGKNIKYPTVNIDLAPTILDLADIRVPRSMDGYSLKKILLNNHFSPIQRSILIEHTGLQVAETTSTCLGLDGLVNCMKSFDCKCTESGNHTYSCIRTIGFRKDEVYCVWEYNFDEYYDLRKDPYQLENTADSLRKFKKTILNKNLNYLRNCSGARCNIP